MKEMNCRRVEKLIPLYVEGDLPSSLAERMATHLEWCGRCNWLADDYAESQNWLHTNEPLVFDEAFLDNFKSDVLQRIGEAGARPSLLASFLQHWSRRQVLALSAALLIIFGTLVFYIYQISMHDSSATREAGVQLRDEEAPISTEPNQVAVIGTSPGAGLTKDGHHKRHTNRATRNAGPTIAKQQAGRQNNRPEDSPVVSNEPAGSVAGSSDESPEMLRIEIQTADPNIRIIWFAPKEVEHPQTNQ